MIGGNAQISGEDNKESDAPKKENENSAEKNEQNINNDKKEEEKKEEKSKKKTTFSFIKRKGPNSNKNLSNISSNINNDNLNINNKENKSSTNDEDLSKLMKATSSKNTTTFEELNNMSNITKNNLNQDELNTNINNLNISKDTNNNELKQKGGGFGGFGFIKRGGINPSKSSNLDESSSSQSTIGHSNEIDNTHKIIEKPKKKFVNILEQYRIKMQEYHGKMFNYNEDFKYFIRKLAQIRKELKDLDDQVKNKKEEANNLLKNQNEQIENNNFDMAEKIEEEIKTTNDKIEQLKSLIKQKNETDLAQVKLTLIELIKEKNNYYDSYLILFIPLLENAGDSLEEAKKEKVDGLKNIKKEIDKVEKDKIENIYKEALKDFEEVEKKINVDFEEEAKDITDNINQLNNKSKDIHNEIEELKNKIKEKEQELIDINNEIEKKNEEKKEIKKKYEKNEEFQEKKKIMEEKKNEYDKIINNLKSIENIYAKNEEKYDKKINEINNIIKTIESNKINYPKRIDNNIKLSKELNEMYISDKEKTKKIKGDQNAIKELLIKLTDNNEKIEVLNMQNKRISSEIASVEANIQNFEDTKKAHVAKKQFKDAQIANNEIKKCQENKAQLNEFLKGNLDEIKILDNDNKETDKAINDFNDEIKNYEKIIKEDNEKYLINLLNILKQFIEDVEDNDPDKKMVEETIKLVSNELYPNGEPQEQNTNNDNDKEKEKEKEEQTKEDINTKENADETNENKDENKKEEKMEKTEKKNEKDEKIEEKKETEEERIKREEEEKINKEKEIEKIKKEIKELEEKLELLINEEKYDECDITNNKIEELKEKLKKLEE